MLLNKYTSLKYIVINLFATACFVCSLKAQGSKVYRLFSKELDNVLITFTITDKKEISVSGKEKNSNAIKQFTEKLEKTSIDSLYFFRIDHFGDKKNKGYAVLIFNDNNRRLQMIVDTFFNNKAAIELFIAHKKNIISQAAFICIEGITLESAQNFPSVITMTPDKIKLIAAENIVRALELEALFGKDISLFSKLGFALYANSEMHFNAQCLLFGYKIPQTKEEYDFIKNAMK
jgi:hypothetical protein